MQRHITEFLGPIFAKEIIEIARRWRYYLCRTVYAVSLLLVMLIAWEQYQVFAARVGIGNSLARFAGVVFTATSHIQYWAVYLLVPAFLCGVVAGEREERTLELLFITPLSDREIVLGKLFSRVAAMVCVILCGVPVVSLIMLFGGVAPESIWRVLAATLLAIFFAGSHAVYFSVIANGPMEALTRTYVAFFFWLAGLPILAWGFREILQASVGSVSDELAEYLAPIYMSLAPVYLIYPLVSFWGAVDETYHTTLAFTYGGWSWPLSFLVPALWAVFLSWRAIRWLRQTPRPRVDWTRWLPWVAWLRRRSARPALSAARRAKAGTTWFGRAVANPLWLRARLTPVYDRAGSIRRLQWLGWTVVLLGILLMLIFSPKDLTEDGCGIAFQAPTWGALALVIALVAGHSLIGDRRRGFLELVIVTPLTGREVVDGTFLALWEHLRRLLWLPWLLGILFCITGASSVGGTIFSLVTATLFCSLLACQGVACSLAAQTTPGAVVATFVLPFAVVMVMPIAALGFRENHGPALWIDFAIWFAVTWIWAWWRLNAASAACCLTALHLVLIALAECWTYGERGDQYPMAAMHPIFLVVAPLVSRGPGSYQDAWTRYWIAIELCYWAALALNIVLIRWWLTRHFDRLVGRTLATPPKRRADSP